MTLLAADHELKATPVDPSAVDAAARAAAEAQPGWAELPFDRRAAVLREAAAVLAAHRAEIVDWVVRETGGLRTKGEGEVAAAIDELRAGAALAAEPYGELLRGLQPGQLSFARRIPVGVVGVITPWNAPLRLAARAVVPALALGNAVLLKPDHQTPICGGAVLAEALRRAGLPAEVLAVVPGGADTGRAVVASEHTAAISFTGSPAAGKEIGATAGGLLKRVVLELGGNNAFIVLDDADLPGAVNNGLFTSLLGNGQICMAAGRHLVHEDLAEEYTAALVEHMSGMRYGDPRVEDGVRITPLINERQAERVERIVGASVAAGAKALLGAERHGKIYAPTVLSGVRPGMPAFDEEIFGPVIPVTTFRTDDEAAELAGATSYRLAAAIHTGSLNRGLALADRMGTGMVHVNGPTISNAPHVPMGGMGDSGNGGRSGGRWNLDEFTYTQWVSALDRPRHYPI